MGLFFSAGLYTKEPLPDPVRRGAIVGLNPIVGLIVGPQIITHDQIAWLDKWLFFVGYAAGLILHIQTWGAWYSLCQKYSSNPVQSTMVFMSILMAVTFEDVCNVVPDLHTCS